MKCDCGRKLKKKDKFCPNCSKKVEEIVNSTENKKNGGNTLIIIVIVLLSMIIILLSVILLTTSDIFSKKDKGLNVVGTTWLNYSAGTNYRLEEKIEFNKDETYKYTTTSYTNGEIDSNNITEGTYKIFDDVIMLYYTYEQSGEERTSEYSIHTYGDYLCFSWRCEEIDRFYLSTDERASQVKDRNEYYNKVNQYLNNELEYVNTKKPTIYIFYSEHDAYCTQLLEWLENYDYKNGYNIVKYDTSSSENSDLYTKVANYLDKSASGVPFVVIGSEAIEGFDKNKIENAIHKAYVDIENNKYCDILKTVKK